MHWQAEVHDAITTGTPPSRDVIAALTAPRGTVLGSGGLDRARRLIADGVLGAGALEAHLADETVTDVLVNADGSVWVDRGDGVERTPGAIPSEQLRPLAVRLAGLARRRLDDAQPWVDGLLPGGVRLHAVLPPLAEAGAQLSLRIPREQPSGIDALVALGSVGGRAAEVLRAIVAARLSFLVVGGTGAGKTTVLAALLGECAGSERLVIVEDVRELAPAHPHVVRLQGRSANVEGIGEVTLVDLVRQALRMRPDRLVVGEVRGAEVRELLAALNTGHEGGASTLHANGAAEVPARLEALGALAGMPRAAVHAQLRGALHAVVVVARQPGRRIVREIGVVAVDPGSPEGFVHVETALSWDGERVAEGPGWVRLERLLRERSLLQKWSGSPVMPTSGGGGTAWTA